MGTRLIILFRGVCFWEQINDLLILSFGIGSSVTFGNDDEHWKGLNEGFRPRKGQTLFYLLLVRFLFRTRNVHAIHLSHSMLPFEFCPNGRLGLKIFTPSLLLILHGMMESSKTFCIISRCSFSVWI